MAAERLLDTIVAHKRDELAQPKAPLPVRHRAVLSLAAALRQPGIRIIGEVKRASPSAGALHGSRPLAPVLAAYDGIVDAVSVLTDARWFGGSLSDLAEVAASARVPVLRKDFIIDPTQVHDAYAYGADAVLLMLSVLDDAAYRACAHAAASAGLETLTEVHDAHELERALSLDAPIIGVNNRSFADLSVDLDVTRRLAPSIPADRIVVSESGFSEATALRSLAPLVDGFLVGTTLMRAPRIDLAVRHLTFGEVKICGLTRAADACAAWDAGASWGGLVFASKSPRRVSLATARRIAAASPLPLVGVFVDADPDDIAAMARAVPLAAVQLHGREDGAQIAAVRAVLPTGCTLWRALAPGAPLPPGIDRVLYDGAAPGTGTRADWSRLPSPAVMAACGLAGGIEVSNVGAALETGAGLIDVSSGVESKPGIKSASHINALFNAIREHYGKVR